MNTNQQQQAKNLYFQTDLDKSQISALLNIDRTSLHAWIRENNWERLKKNANILPAMLAEDVYYLISQFTRSLLTETRIMRPVTFRESETLHKLTITVGKLKSYTTLNETMELFAHFIDHLNAKAPEVAKIMAPHVEEYIASRAAVNNRTLTPPKFNTMGFIPVPDTDTTEKRLDMDDIFKWTESEDPLVFPQEPVAQVDPKSYTASTPVAADPQPANPVPVQLPEVSTPATATGTGEDAELTEADLAWRAEIMKRANHILDKYKDFIDRTGTSDANPLAA